MPELQDHTHAACLWPTAHHGDVAPGLSLFGYCFDCTTDQESLVSCSKICKALAACIQSLPCVARPKFTQNFDHSKFHTFLFSHPERACEICEN